MAREAFIIHPEIQFLDLQTQRKMQEEKLKIQLHYLQTHSPFYRQFFETHHIQPGDVNTLADLAKIPTVSKADLQAHGRSFIACPSRELADFSTTSGSGGLPLTVPVSFHDLERLGWNEACSFQLMELDSDDIIQLTTTLDRSFMAGMAYMEGARKLKIPFVRAGAGMPELQWERIFSLGTTVLIAVPSFILKLLDYAIANGIRTEDSKIRKILCIGESIRHENFEENELALRIRQHWDVKLYGTYASTEMQTAFTECSEGKGGHHIPDLLITEFLDEEGNTVSEGTAGELTITHLGVTGMPLLRFRTGDICMHYLEACSCGRKTLRVGPIIGRKNQMIKLKGTTIFPVAFQNVANAFPEISDYMLFISSNEMGTDEVQLIIKTEDPSEMLLKKLKDSFRARLRVTPDIEVDKGSKIAYLREKYPSRKVHKVIDAR